jgi:hypothetical protein
MEFNEIDFLIIIGCGKTTMLNVLAGRIKKFEGSVKLNGVEYRQKFHHVSGYVTQGISLLFIFLPKCFVLFCFVLFCFVLFVFFLFCCYFVRYFVFFFVFFCFDFLYFLEFLHILLGESR